MEYDNDRIRELPRIELLYWIPMVLVNPLINSVTLFPSDARIWLVLLNVSVMLTLVYLLYSRLVAPLLLIQRRYRLFTGLCLLSFGCVHLLLISTYGLVRLFPLNVTEAAYFSYHIPTLIRESLWAMISLFLATIIASGQKTLGHQLKDDQKDHVYFKLRYLRAQLNPHFLFNTLNSIYSLSLQQSEKTPEVVIKLADLMRYLIYECNEEKISLEKEIDFIRNYIDIEKIRHKADIRFVVEGDIKGVMVEPFLFISFIENGFKHAMDGAFHLHHP
jgi:two-component system, LytTR family, sensor kinase